MLVLGAARIIGDTYHSGTLMPTAANTQDIGSETMPWRWVYAQYLYGDGSHIININAENIDQGVLSTARIPNLSWNKITSDKPDYVTRWPKWNEIAQSGAENLSEGGSDLTDNTEILTSYASNSGFNDTHAQGVVYKRDAIHVYNYIKGKLDSIYATQATVDGLLSAANAMIFQGTLGTGGTVTALPATHNAGWTYRVITAGTYAGKYCEVGTLIICIKDGTATADADWTSVETNEDGSVIGPNSATDNAIAVFNGNTGRIIKNGQYVTYLNHAAANAGTSQIGCIDGLMITGTAYGNAEDLVSNKAGQLSYGDAGPQIRFSSSGQLGAVIFDHYDSTSGMGASFNFVSNQGDAAVKAGGIIAQTRAMIGGNSVNNNYVLYSNGATYINGATTINSTLKTTGTINVTPASGEGGEIHLNASTANTTQAGIILDQLNSQLRIFGIASVDGTTKTGTGTPLVIDPYAKTITGGYTITGALIGNVTGNATTATSATKLSNTTAIGSNVKPVYFTSDGIPQATATEMIRGFTTTSAGTDLNTYYDSGMYSITGGDATNYPTGGSEYATLLTVAYRKPSGNTKPDYAWQMGSFTQNNDRLWYRNSSANTWRAWRQIVNIATNTAVGNGTTPVYVTADGVVKACTAYADASVANASKISAKLAATTKTFLLGTSTTITNTATNVELIGDTGVYLTATAGEFSAVQHSYNISGTEKAYTYYNNDDQSIDFVFV